MKKLVIGFVLGVTLTMGTTVLASDILNVVENKFDIEFFGANVNTNTILTKLRAYNINGTTYLSLRDFSELFSVPISFENNIIKIGSLDDIDVTSFLLNDYSDIPNIDEVFTSNGTQPLYNININGNTTTLSYVSDFGFKETVDNFEKTLKADGFVNLTEKDWEDNLPDSYNFNKESINNMFIKGNRVIQILASDDQQNGLSENTFIVEIY